MTLRTLMIGLSLACSLVLGACNTSSKATNASASSGPVQKVEPPQKIEPAQRAEAPVQTTSNDGAAPKIMPPIGADGLVAVGNAYCPLEPEHPVKPRVRPENARLWKGKAVGFCCEDCPEAWDAMTPEQRNDVLVKAGAR